MVKNKQKVTFFSVLAAVSAATTALTSSTPSVKPLFIVLPLVIMGIFLFFAGYYAGLTKNTK